MNNKIRLAILGFAFLWLAGIGLPIASAQLEQLPADQYIDRMERPGRVVNLKVDEVLAKLDAIFPGPGGEAPEAYAW